MGDGPYSCTIDDDPCFRSSHGVGLCSSPGLNFAAQTLITTVYLLLLITTIAITAWTVENRATMSQNHNTPIHLFSICHLSDYMLFYPPILLPLIIHTLEESIPV